MAIDAVFPAASELVMLYAGAVAAGAFSSAHHVSVFGAKLGFGPAAYVTVALAGTFGYLIGAVIGWWIGIGGGRPYLERGGGGLHVTLENPARAGRWFDRWGNAGFRVGRVPRVPPAFVSFPAGVFEMPLVPYTALTLVGSAIWAFAFAGVGYALGSSYEHFHNDFRFVEYAVVAGVLAVVAYLIYRLTRAAKVRRP